MEDTTAWSAEQAAFIDARADTFTEKEKKIMSIDFLKKVVEVIPGKTENQADFDEFKTRTSDFLVLIPQRNEKGKLKTMDYLRALSLYKNYIQKKYKVVAKGHYTAIWLPLGVALGLPYGLLFKNLALGLGFGIALGGLFGAYMDNKAKKENRVL